MAVSTERDPVALRADLAAWLAARTGAGARRGRRGQHPGPVGLLERDAALRGDLGRRGPPARDPRRADRPHRVPGHRLRHPGAGDAGARAPRARVPVPEVLWFEQDPSILGARFVCMAPGRGRGAGRQPRLPRRRAGCRPSTPDAQRARVGERHRHDGRIHQLDRAALGLDWIARRHARPSSSRSTASTARSRAATCPTRRWTAPSRSSRRPCRPPTDAPALCWGDSRIGNMIFGADQRGRRGARLGDGHRRRSRCRTSPGTCCSTATT